MTTLENLVIVPGDLRASLQLEPETFQHVDEITNLRRTHPDLKMREKLRDTPLYTADGNLYTDRGGTVLWGITRGPQNLVLTNLDEAFRELTNSRNYFPNASEALTALTHRDTVVIDSQGLELQKDTDEYGHFTINPQKIGGLHSQQRKAALRIYGPDEKSFDQNMEMFAKGNKSPNVYVLMPDYVKSQLKNQSKQFVGRASWLIIFVDHSNFGAGVRNVYDHDGVLGVRRASVSEPVEDAPVGRATEKSALYAVEELYEGRLLRYNGNLYTRLPPELKLKE